MERAVWKGKIHPLGNECEENVKVLANKTFFRTARSDTDEDETKEDDPKNSQS